MMMWLVFISFRKVLVLITFISAPVSIFKIIGILPTFNFTCQGSIFFLWKFILAYKPKEISLSKLFPYFANILCPRPTTYCEVIHFITVSANFSFCCTVINFIFVALLFIATYSLLFVNTFFHPKCFVVSFLSLVNESSILRLDLFIATGYFDGLIQTKVFSKVFW